MHGHLHAIGGGSGSLAALSQAGREPGRWPKLRPRPRWTRGRGGGAPALRVGAAILTGLGPPKTAGLRLGAWAEARASPPVRLPGAGFYRSLGNLSLSLSAPAGHGRAHGRTHVTTPRHACPAVGGPETGGHAEIRLSRDRRPRQQMQQRWLDPCLPFKRASSTVFGRPGGLGAAATSGAPHYVFSHPPTLRVRDSERESDEAMERALSLGEGRGLFHDRYG